MRVRNRVRERDKERERETSVGKRPPSVSKLKRRVQAFDLQGYLAHKKQPLPLGPP